MIRPLKVPAAAVFLASIAFGASGCTTTPPSTTPPSTTTTTTTTTTTVAPRPPVAAADKYSVPLGESVTGNVLANDDLGNPPGSVALILWVGGSTLPGTPGTQALGTITMETDGSFVFQNTGVPAGSRIFYNYQLTNSLGTSTGVLEFSGA